MALMKAATQSETLWNYDPSLAVDGDTNTCSFTPQSDVQRWWQVSPDANIVSTTWDKYHILQIWCDQKNALELYREFHVQILGLTVMT